MRRWSELAERVAATTRTSEKTALLADYLRSLSPESLSSAFDDIESLAAGCQFRDCRHEAEPGCAVVGHVDPDRLRNFHKLQREVRRNQQTALERIAERQKWKSLMKSVAARNRLKWS